MSRQVSKSSVYTAIMYRTLELGTCIIGRQVCSNSIPTYPPPPPRTRQYYQYWRQHGQRVERAKEREIRGYVRVMHAVYKCSARQNSSDSAHVQILLAYYRARIILLCCRMQVLVLLRLLSVSLLLWLQLLFSCVMLFHTSFPLYSIFMPRG